MTRSRNSRLEHQPPRHDRQREHASRLHDVQNIYVSLKQWRILHAVIDCGGFAEAAKHLHLSQSAISYTVAKLQEQLNVPVLKIEGRKATLTNAGRELLQRSRHVLKEAIELEMFARGLRQGWGSELRLVVDHNFPAKLLMSALRQFDELGLGVHVRLREAVMPRAEEVLRDASVDLAISPRVPLGFLGEPLIDVEYLAVAHPAHPLLALGREITATDLERELRVGIGASDEFDSGGMTVSKPAHRWNMSSLHKVIEAVSEGFGYAWLPKQHIQHHLDQGRLVPLPLLGDAHSFRSVLYLIHGLHRSGNPAANKLADVLRNLAMAEQPARSPEEGDEEDCGNA